MKVFCFSSKDNNSVWAAIGAESWAYTKTQKSHGGIKPGDYIILYSRQSGCVECVGIVLTEPDYGVENKDSYWPGSFWDPFTFTVVAKNSISLDALKEILGTDANLNEYLSLFYVDAPATLSSVEVAKIINAMQCRI